MRRILIISAAAVVATAPALTGLLGNQSFAQSVPVTVPAQASTADDRGSHPEPGDDHGGRATATASSSHSASASRSADDHGIHAEPGDDHGGRATATATASHSHPRATRPTTTASTPSPATTTAAAPPPRPPPRPASPRTTAVATTAGTRAVTTRAPARPALTTAGRPVRTAATTEVGREPQPHARGHRGGRRTLRGAPERGQGRTGVGDLATGRSTGRAERPVRTGRVLVQVIAAAAIVLLAVAVAGSVASRKLAERESVTDAAHVTDLLADAVVQPALDDGLLDGAPAAVASIDAAVRTHVLGPSIVRVKIWSPDGRVLYSDEPRIMGETFALGEEERLVLVDPTTRAEVSDLQRPENRYEQGQGKLLEVYRPVWTPSGQALLFETYSPYASVTGRTGELWRGFAGTTLTSLLLLVLLLMPVLWRLLDQLRRSQAHREALLRQRWTPRPRSGAGSRPRCTMVWCRSWPPPRSPSPAPPSGRSPSSSRSWPGGSGARPPRSGPASAACARCSSTSTRPACSRLVWSRRWRTSPRPSGPARSR